LSSGFLLFGGLTPFLVFGKGVALYFLLLPLGEWGLALYLLILALDKSGLALHLPLLALDK